MLRLAAGVHGAGDVDHAAVRPEDRQEADRQREVAEMIDAELRLDALRGQRQRARHHAGVVDEQVQRAARREEGRAERAHGFEVGEIERRHLEPAGVRGQRGAEPRRDLLAVGQRAASHDARWRRRTRAPGGLDAQPRVRPGDDGGQSIEPLPAQGLDGSGVFPEGGVRSGPYGWHGLSLSRDVQNPLPTYTVSSSGGAGAAEALLDDAAARSLRTRMGAGGGSALALVPALLQMRCWSDYTGQAVPARPLSSIGRRRSVAALTIAAAGGLAVLAGARLKKADGAAGGNAAAPAHFVGSQACAGCHAGEQAAWSSSHHRHAMEPADARSVLGDFGDVTFRYFGRETRFSRQGSTFQITTENQQGKAETFKIAYTLGVAPLQQYLVAFDDGRIQALPFAWDARPRGQGGQRWFHLYPDTDVTPADPLFWMRPRQNWNHMCGDCHTTSFSKRFSDATGRFDSQWSELGNGCESCHGAGSAHVEAAQHEPRRTGRRRAREYLVNGLHTQAEQLDQCGACHARRVRLREDASHEHMHDTWRPELLQEGLYFVDGQIKDEVFEIGSFLQSKMAARGITCSHCHDPHTARLRAEGNALCTQCHDRQLFDGPQHHFHAAGTDGARCVNCHMPPRTYMVVHERRDHRIAVPRPDLSAALGYAERLRHVPRGARQRLGGRPRSPSTAAGDARARRARSCSARRCGARGTSRPDAVASVRALLDNPTVAGLSKATALSALGASAPGDGRRRRRAAAARHRSLVAAGRGRGAAVCPGPRTHPAAGRSGDRRFARRALGGRAAAR